MRRTLNHKATFDADGFSRVTIEFQMIGMRPSPAITRCAQLEVPPIYGLSAPTIYGENDTNRFINFSWRYRRRCRECVKKGQKNAPMFRLYQRRLGLR